LSTGKKSIRKQVDFSSLLDQTSIKVSNGVKIAVKRYTKPSGLIKWFLLNFPPIPFYYPLTLDPVERMRRELAFFNSRIDGVFCPKVYKTDWEGVYIEREYVEGRGPSLESSEDIERLGEAIASIHSSGFCLGDTKPENFLFSEDERGVRVYVIDAEQSLANCNKKRYFGWDIMLVALFIFWSNPLISPESFASKFQSLKKGYQERGKEMNWGFLKEAHPLVLLIPPRLIMEIRNLTE